MADDPEFSANTRFDWIDVLGILLAAGGCVAVAGALHLDRFWMRLLGIFTIFAVPWVRRKWLGVPNRTAPRAASALGLLSTLLLVVGVILGIADIALVYAEATRPPPTEEEKLVLTDPHARAIQLAEIGAVAVALIVAGGAIDTKLSRDADKAA
jgi:hypothetical protein